MPTMFTFQCYVCDVKAEMYFALLNGRNSTDSLIGVTLHTNCSQLSVHVSEYDSWSRAGVSSAKHHPKNLSAYTIVRA